MSGGPGRNEQLHKQASGRLTGDIMNALQRPSHGILITDRSKERVTTTGRDRRLDAIVVPAARRAHWLKGVAKLAAACNTLLVILASHDCLVGEAAELVGRTPGCRALIVRVPPGYRHDLLKFETDIINFQVVNAGRQSNLSHKRNLGLLLARLLGWKKLMFLDDDISGVTPTHLDKVAAQLERHQVTGLVSMQFPDNSVVCHANRLIGAPQGNFISGATLGVNMTAEPLDFFPDIYNEDWLAFAAHAEAGEIISVGEGRQQEFNPYRDPNRAANEEFGDVIAEGLYALFSDGLTLNRATETYWTEFIGARRDLIDTIAEELPRIETNESVQAQESIRHASKQLGSITAADCDNFVSAWRLDRATFAKRVKNLKPMSGCAAALDHLGLSDWRLTEFGVGKLEVPWTIDLPFAGRLA